jgi:hypothetical protein
MDIETLNNPNTGTVGGGGSQDFFTRIWNYCSENPVIAIIAVFGIVKLLKIILL